MAHLDVFHARVITRAPSLNDVLAAEGKSISLSMAEIEALADVDSKATCKLSELPLSNVRNIVVDSNDHQFSFEADHRFSYEHSSYNQSSMRTDITKYRVIVRWTYNREEYSQAHLLLIK